MKKTVPDGAFRSKCFQIADFLQLSSIPYTPTNIVRFKRKGLPVVVFDSSTRLEVGRFPYITEAQKFVEVLSYNGINSMCRRQQINPVHPFLFCYEKDIVEFVQKLERNEPYRHPLHRPVFVFLATTTEKVAAYNTIADAATAVDVDPKTVRQMCMQKATHPREQTFSFCYQEDEAAFIAKTIKRNSK